MHIGAWLREEVLSNANALYETAHGVRSEQDNEHHDAVRSATWLRWFCTSYSAGISATGRRATSHRKDEEVATYTPTQRVSDPVTKENASRSAGRQIA